MNFLDAIDPLDEFGFWIRPHKHWLGESPSEEFERLQFNHLMYIECLKNGARFPQEIIKAREADYRRLQQLWGVAA